MRIDWLAKLRNALQVAAFALAISAIQYAFSPERPYAPLVAYSLCIGMLTWAAIDLGRHAFPSAAETGWPRGLGHWGLVLGSMAFGYLAGTFLGDQLCRALDLYAGARPGPRDVLRDVMVSAIAGTVGVFYFYSIHKSGYLERKVGEAQQHANEARLKLLETQLEPHMLFNTLANLRVLIGVDPREAERMLDHMIAYLRATLGASRATTHALSAEFDRLADYLALMRIRMGPRLDYALDLPPELAAEPVATLLLQPLVENSIRHGLEPKVEGGRIEVRARRDGAMLEVEVSDTGVGLRDDAASPRGFGVAQIRERLATLYGSRGSLQFAAPPGPGTRALVRFPAQAA